MDGQSEISNSEFSIIDELTSQGGLRSLDELPEMMGYDSLIFRQVEFVGFCKLSDGKFSVRYKIVSSDFKPRTSDRVALYKLGFKSSQEYLSYKWAIVPDSSARDIPLTLLFDGNQLPPPSDDHYQFCYLNSSSEMVGVSHPFLIPIENQTEDTVMKAQQSEALKELQKQHSLLQMKTMSDEKEIQSLTESSKELQMDFDNLKEKLREKQAEIDEMEPKLKESYHIAQQSQEELYEMEKNVENKEKENEELQQKIISLVEDMNKLKEAYEAYRDMKNVAAERQSILEKDNSRLTGIVTKLRDQITILEANLDEVTKSKEAAETIAAELSCSLQTHTAENKRLLRKIKQEKNKAKQFQRNMLMSTSSLEEVSNDSFSDMDLEDEEEDETVPDIQITNKPNPEVMEASVCSNCSVGAQKLTETLENKMESMVQSLTSQMEILKQEIAKVQLSSNSEASSQAAKVTEPNAPLYSQSFLPTDKTAPVFLPRMRNSPVRDPSCPSPAVNKPIIPDPQPQLPSPLKPEATLTACQAALMKLVHKTEPVSNTPDEEDYISADEPDPNEIAGLHQLVCPICDVKFQTNSLILLEEHVESHLECICPICSKGFERKDRQNFEKHVQEHLSEEDDLSGNGGWINSSRFDLLEID